MALVHNERQYKRSAVERIPEIASQTYFSLLEKGKIPERETLPSPAEFSDTFTGNISGKPESTVGPEKIIEAPPTKIAKKETPEKVIAPPAAIASLDEPIVEESTFLSRVGHAMGSVAHKVGDYIFGDNSLQRYDEITNRINELEPKVAALTDGQLKAKTGELRETIKREQAKGRPLPEILDELLPEAFAVMREADMRVLNMRPFDEQVMAGIGAHEGKIVEQKTGEGKTLMETLPVYLNALAGKGVHVVTVNEYLAGRDAEWMGHALEFMGISVGVIKREMTPEERKIANQKDVTYGTNDEFGFQYLRDNLAHDKESRAGRDLKDVFALVDEVDSILVDEARTPLIISRQSPEEQPPYDLFAELAQHLQEGYDYTVDRKRHTTVLTEKGSERAEKMMGIDNMYSDENFHLVPYVRNAITAKALYDNDVDYVAKDAEVTIVDEFTGRLQPGRRYSDGLHEAIEAKEGVPVKPRTETLAMITYQNYFKLYGKLAGMTGTAKSAEKEFQEVFGKNVAVIRTHMPVIRKNFPDVVYKSEDEKFDAVARHVKKLYESGQPVLVGTRSIEKSEFLANKLAAMGIPHQVLNAKNHFKEADIIAQAGRPGMVTVATNMAGRGVDIKLGGDPEKLAKAGSEQNGVPNEDVLKKYKELCKRDKERVIESGGLAIIGTERHEDRRVDDQLRGRAGRQGDPGTSQFFVSLEDELIRLFGGDKVRKLADRLGLPDGEPIQNKVITKAIEIAQEKCQERNLEIRKNLMRYDGVMNSQREAVYGDRDAVLDGESLRPIITDMLKRSVMTVIDRHGEGAKRITPDKIAAIDKDLRFLFSVPGDIIKNKKLLNVDELTGYLVKYSEELYTKKEQRMGEDIMRILEREIFLSVLDEKWVLQQTSLKDLREGIWLRAYGQQDPDVEYLNEAHQMFDSMKDSVAMETVRALFSLRPIGIKK